MTAQNKTPESSVTDDMIRRVHLTLADVKTGEEILSFLRSTEPVFMEEVNRFIKTEIARMRYQLNETQCLYIGSIVGAAYIAGFLIAREATHQMFNGLLTMKADIKTILTPSKIDEIVDKNREEGKSYKQIARIIRQMLEKEKKISAKPKKEDPPKQDRGKRLNLGDLD